MMRLVSVLAILLVLIQGQGYARQLETIHRLETAGGIKDDTQCSVYSYLDEESKSLRTSIICNDGWRIDEPVSIEGSTTGTPAWLEYENFIGSYELSKGILPGSGRQKMFFDGPTRHKTVEE